jgi:hypothetical protein
MTESSVFDQWVDMRAEIVVKSILAETGLMEYITKRLPSAIPGGKVLVHNQVYPVARRPGTRGSRCWLQEPSDRLEPCDCGWAPELGGHYRVAGSRP